MVGTYPGFKLQVVMVARRVRLFAPWFSGYGREMTPGMFDLDCFAHCAMYSRSGSFRRRNRFGKNGVTLLTVHNWRSAPGRFPFPSYIFLVRLQCTIYFSCVIFVWFLRNFPSLTVLLGDPNILRDIGGLMISCAGNILSLQLLLILPL